MEKDEKSGKQGLANLIKEFLEKVSYKPEGDGGSKFPEDLWEGLIEFDKGIFSLAKEETKAGWSALQIVKEMLSGSGNAVGNESKLRFIERIENRILERMWFLCDGLEISMGTTQREEFARWTGKYDFFDGKEKPKITFTSNGNGNNPRRENTPPSPQSNQDVFEKMIRTTERLSQYAADLRSRIVEYDQPTNGWQKIAIWGGSALIIAFLIFGYLFVVPIKNEAQNLRNEVTGIIDYQKVGFRILEEMKDSLMVSQDSLLIKINAKFTAVQDSVNKLMPPPKLAKIKK